MHFKTLSWNLSIWDRLQIQLYLKGTAITCMLVYFCSDKPLSWTDIKKDVLLFPSE